MENALMPSFSPDFKELDEAGIRRDVRQSIRHGFCSSTVTAVGATAAQHTQLMEIVREESGNRILSSINCRRFRRICHSIDPEAEKLGFTKTACIFTIFHATVLALLGLDHVKLTYRYSGRDFRLTDVAGVVARKIFVC